MSIRSSPLLGIAALCLVGCSAIIDGAISAEDPTTPVSDDGAGGSGSAPGAGGGAGAGGSGAGGAGAGRVDGSSGTGGSPPLACRESASVAASDCPEACDRCEDDGATCVIDCTGDASCDGSTVRCPAGLHCRVECLAARSCKGATIECPADTRCEVACSGKDACAEARVECSANGPCSLGCDAGSGDEGQATTEPCVGATMRCGDNACSCDASGDQAPELDCGRACECEECP